MVLLIDANVLIDYLEKREPFYKNAFAVFSDCAQKKHYGFISSNSVVNCFYILRKKYTSQALRQLFSALFKIIDIADVTKKMVLSAIDKQDFADFEDCIQSECASQILADYIITRNTKDFAESNITAITPEDFLALDKRSKNA